jgi:hypothetical protein
MTPKGTAIDAWLGDFASPVLGIIAFCIVSLLVWAAMSPVSFSQYLEVLKGALAWTHLSVRSVFWRGFKSLRSRVEGLHND